METKNRINLGTNGKQKEARAKNKEPLRKECELSALYNLISTKFSKSVSSIEEAEEIFNVFIGDYFEIRKQLQDQQNESKQAENEQIDATEVLKRKVKRYKTKSADLEKQLLSAEAELEKAQQNEEKQKILAENEARKNQRLVSEIECLKKKLEINSFDNANVEDSQSIQILEGLLEDQNKEIAALSNQRDTILKQLHNFNQVTEKTEEELKKLISQNESLQEFKEAAEKKLTTAKRELPELARQIDEMLPDEVHDMLEYTEENEPSAFIMNVIKSLVNANNTQKKAANEKSAVAHFSKDEKYAELLKKLEDAMRYIMTSGQSYDSKENKPLAADQSVQSQVVKQCAKIGKFIDENMMNLNIRELADEKSIFDAEAFKNQESRMKAVFDENSDEQLEEGPLRELFVMFCAVCEVNNHIMTKIKQMKDKVKSAENLVFHNDLIRKLQHENEELKEKTSTIQSKFDQCAEAIGKKLGVEEGDISSIIPHFLDSFVEIKKENEDNKKQVQELTEEIQKLSEEKEKNENELNEEIENLKEENKQITEEKEAQKDNHEESISQLFAEKEELEEKLQAAQEEAATNVKKLTKKLKKMSTATAQSNATISDLRTTVQKMSEDNGKLLTQNEDMKETLRKQGEQIITMQENDKKLRISREQLKNQIQEAGIAHSKEIQLLKQQIVEISNDSTKQIAELQNEILISKNIISSTQESCDKLLQQKSALVQANTKLKLSERSLKLKIAQIDENKEVEKNAAEARESSFMSALKAQAAKQISDIVSQYEDSKKTMAKILSEKFEVDVPETATFNEVVESLEEQCNKSTFDINVLNDAMKIRSHLKLQKDTTLSTAFNNIVSSQNNAEESLKETNKKMEKLENDLSQLKESSDKLNVLAKEASKWENWARAAFYQIADVASSEMSIKEIKDFLEEVIIGNIDKKPAIRRVNILRAEKKLLSNREIANELPSRGGSISSVRPILVSLVFARRLQDMAAESSAMKNAQIDEDVDQE